MQAVGKPDPKLASKASGWQDGKARLAFDRHDEPSNASKGARKEPVDKADMADIHNAQAVLPYIADIHRHYRDSEARALT